MGWKPRLETGHLGREAKAAWRTTKKGTSKRSKQAAAGIGIAAVSGTEWSKSAASGVVDTSKEFWAEHGDQIEAAGALALNSVKMVGHGAAVVLEAMGEAGDGAGFQGGFYDG